MQNLKSLLILVLACTVGVHTFAEGQKESVPTNIQIEAERAKGAHLRAEFNGLVTMIKAKELETATLRAVELRKKYEATFDHNLKQLVFQSKVEFIEFTKPATNRFEWVDVSYGELLQMQAFIAAERKNFPVALDILKTIASVTPTSAGNAAETGYILSFMGKPEQGLIAYRRAYNLSIKYASQKAYRAPALRGIGSSLIDLKKLDEAEDAFLASLAVEPGNKVAINELAYIKDQRKSK